MTSVKAAIGASRVFVIRDRMGSRVSTIRAKSGEDALNSYLRNKPLFHRESLGLFAEEKVSLVRS